MRRIGVLTLVAGAALAILLQAPAGAQRPDDPGLRKCMREINTIEAIDAGMSCQKVGGGEWQPVSDGSSIPDVESMFGTFIFVGLLLSLFPAFIGASLSKDAGVSGAAGFGIGLVGSWVGVIGLYLYGHSQRRGNPVITIGRQADAGGGPAVGTKREPPEPEAPAERLRALKDLLDQGLITQAEYDERRKATVDSL